MKTEKTEYKKKKTQINKDTTQINSAGGLSDRQCQQNLVQGRCRMVTTFTVTTLGFNSLIPY